MKKRLLQLRRGSDLPERLWNMRVCGAFLSRLDETSMQWAEAK